MLTRFDPTCFNSCPVKLPTRADYSNLLHAMTPFDALSEMPNLVADYKQAKDELIAAQRELQTLKSDKYVPLEWVCSFWGVTDDTARDMIRELAKLPGGREVRVLSYKSKIVRYLRSDIERITQQTVRTLAELMAQKKTRRGLALQTSRQDKAGP